MFSHSSEENTLNSRLRILITIALCLNITFVLISFSSRHIQKVDQENIIKQEKYNPPKILTEKLDENVKQIALFETSSTYDGYELIRLQQRVNDWLVMNAHLNIISISSSSPSTQVVVITITYTK